MNDDFKAYVIILSSALLLSGCISTNESPMSQSLDRQFSPSYKFPAEIYEGYWASKPQANGEAVVIDFRGDVSNNYRFKCNANGSYRQTNIERISLVPSTTGMGTTVGHEPIMSELSVMRLNPKRLLVLKQRFTTPKLKHAIPNGLKFSYSYTPTLKPLCL